MLHGSSVVVALACLSLAPVLAQDERARTSRPLPLGQRLGLAGQQHARGRAQAHRDAIAASGVGLYFGSRSSFGKSDLPARLSWIETHRKVGTDPGLPNSTSCIDWALECVEAAYRGVGRPRDAERIERAVVRGGGKGTVLLRELIARGWVGVYWNPDVRRPSDGDNEHTYSSLVATTARSYYRLRVRHFIRNFRPSAGSPTVQETSGLEKLRAAPFWVGIARGGNHVFVGYQGTMSEVHWDRQPDSTTLIHEHPFEEFDWCSGMLVVPPGTWPKKVPVSGMTAVLAPAR